MGRVGADVHNPKARTLILWFVGVIEQAAELSPIDGEHAVEGIGATTSICIDPDPVSSPLPLSWTVNSNVVVPLKSEVGVYVSVVEFSMIPTVPVPGVTDADERITVSESTSEIAGEMSIVIGVFEAVCCVVINETSTPGASLTLLTVRVKVSVTVSAGVCPSDAVSAMVMGPASTSS